MSFLVDGLEALVEDMKSLGEALDGPLADAMLQAGAEAEVKAWKDKAQAHGHVDTGAMLESIKADGHPRNVGQARTISVYPRGRDQKGVRNAEKAFILNYGTSSIPPSGWADEAMEDSEEQVIAAMNEAFQSGK